MTTAYRLEVETLIILALCPVC